VASAPLASNWLEPGSNRATSGPNVSPCPLDSIIRVVVLYGQNRRVRQGVTEINKAAGAKAKAGGNGRGGRPARREHDDDEPTRDRIFRIATELFARNGFDATGVQELSEAVGLGRGALYYHIKSKEDLLFSICTALLDNMLEEAVEISESDLPVEVRIHRLAEVLVRDLADKRDAWTVSLSELRALPPAKRRTVIARRDRFEDVWSRLLGEGARDGILRPVDDVALRGILGLLNSTHLWIAEAGRMRPEEVADTYIDLIMEGLRPR
jgi:TetR/AcrR family transcriptional regulator, cholesterol catabolism regulator